MKRIFPFLLLVTVLTACDNNIKKDDLIGKYGFSEDTDTIVVNGDGTYYHYLTTEDGQILENRGTWQYDTISEYVLFEEFSFFTDDVPAGNWFSRVRAKDGEIDLMYAAETNIYFRKVDTPKKNEAE